MPFTVITSIHQGAREEQQDAAGHISDGKHLLVVLCDGAGGHRGGSRASKVGVVTARNAFEQAKGRFSDPPAALRDICKTANEEIIRLGETPKLAPRSTIVTLYLDGQQAHWIYMGDSRIYRLRDGKILDRTKDHTMVQILLQHGEITEEEMGTHPDQGRLLRALGSEEEFRPTSLSFDLGKNDAFLLCSDGFWERTTRAEIENLFSTTPTQEKLDAAVAQAVQRNGSRGDNVAVQIVYFDQTALPPSMVRWPFLLLLILAFLLAASQVLGYLDFGIFPKKLAMPPQSTMALPVESR